VAFASKIFGVFMTMAGIAIGGILFATLGRMPTLADRRDRRGGSNLLYADLAPGRAVHRRLRAHLRLDRSGRTCGWCGC
jgi:PAT family beta-lactamase induction signal transducer AmpG